MWAERTDRYALPETVDRVWADVLLGSIRANRPYASGAATAVPFFTRALELARRLDNAEALWLAAGHFVFDVRGAHWEAAQLALAEEFADRPRTGVRTFMLGLTLERVAHVLLCAGQRPRTEALLREVTELAERTGHAYLLRNERTFAGAVLTLDGRLAEAVAVGELLLTQGDGGADLPAARIEANVAGLRALLHRGEAAAGERMAHSPVTRALSLAHIGRQAEAKELLDRLLMQVPGIGTPDATIMVAFVALWLEAAVLAEHREAAERLCRRLRASSLVTSGLFYPTCISRHLGAAAMLFGEYARAWTDTEQALAVATRLRFRPEVALARLQLADLLLAHFPTEAAVAVEHLDMAVPEFAAMGMQPALERAARLRAAAGTPSRPAPAFPDGLTEREVEVLCLIAAGRSNAEIAGDLVLSVRTVERHIANAYDKIGARGRAARGAAATYALTHGLLASPPSRSA